MQDLGLSFIVSSRWLYPALEVLHITGIALLLGSLVLVELRLWGVAGDVPAMPLARLGLSVSVAGFGLVAGSGLLMFAGHPGELLANRAFVIKMGLVALAGLNAGVFHLRGGLLRADGVARAQTVLSLGVWLAVIICGRWIAYV